MEQAIKAGGWILAMIGFLAAGLLATKYMQTNDELGVQRALADGYQKSANTFKESYSEANGTLLATRKELEAVKAELAALKGTGTGGAVETVPVDGAVAGADGVTSSVDGETPDGEAPMKGMMASMMKMFEGEEGEKMAASAASMTVNMQYGQFLADLKLTPEVDAQVREILNEAAKNQMLAGMEMMKAGKIDPEKAKAMAGEYTEGTRSKLAEVMTPEQLTAWDEYEVEKPRVMLEQTYGMQLGLMAPSLEEDTRKLVAETIADEMMSDTELATSMATGMPAGDPSAALDSQIEAMRRAVESLSGQLTEDQMAQVQRFLEQQEAAINMSRGMLEGMLQGAGATPENAEGQTTPGN